MRRSQAHRRQPTHGRPRPPQTRTLQLAQQAVNAELVIDNGHCHWRSSGHSSKH